MMHKLTPLFLGLILAGPAMAAPVDAPVDVQREAVAGDHEAQLEMGILYEYGFFMRENKVPALAWYMVAAERGNQIAVKRRDRLMGGMTQAQIDEARRQSERLVREKQLKSAPETSP